MTNKEVREFGTYVKSVFTDEYRYYRSRCAREKRSLRELKEALEALPKLLKVYRGVNADFTCLCDVEDELKVRIEALEESVTECKNMGKKFGKSRCAREKRSLGELKEALEALPKLLKVYRGVNAEITCLCDVEDELKARIEALEESVTECENMRQKFGKALNIKMRKNHDNKDI